MLGQSLNDEFKPEINIEGKFSCYHRFECNSENKRMYSRNAKNQRNLTFNYRVGSYMAVAQLMGGAH